MCRLSETLRLPHAAYMRLDEHKRDKTSVIATHCNSNSHTFNFSEPQVLDEEAAWGKRKVSESLHIQLAPSLQ